MSQSTHLPEFKNIKVTGARAVILLDEEDNKTKSGIILMPNAKEPKFEGLVVATGPGARLETGVQMPMEVTAGDRVIYSRMAGVPVRHNEKELLIVNERDIIAIIESPEA